MNFENDSKNIAVTLQQYSYKIFETLQKGRKYNNY